jgi:hypothetical protein
MESDNFSGVYINSNFRVEEMLVENSLDFHSNCKEKKIIEWLLAAGV